MSDQETIARLDVIISLLLPTFDEKKYDFKGIKLEVLKLCDFGHTVADMVKQLKKPRTAIDKSLSGLRKEGYIRTIVKGSDNVYIRLK